MKNCPNHADEESWSGFHKQFTRDSIIFLPNIREAFQAIISQYLRNISTKQSCLRACSLEFMKKKKKEQKYNNLFIIGIISDEILRLTLKKYATIELLSSTTDFWDCSTIDEEFRILDFWHSAYYVIIESIVWDNKKETFAWYVCSSLDN